MPQLEPVNHPLAEQARARHADVFRLEAEILKLPQVEMPVEHDHCTGLYARTLHIPAGTVLTGAIHRHECFFVLRTGHLLLHAPSGPMEVGPGFMSITNPGDKRAGFAVTDAVVTTFHANPTEERDPHALWDLFTVPPEPAALIHDPAPQLEQTP